MTPIARTIETATHGRFLLQTPETGTADALLVGFHGYAENAERHMDQLQRLPGVAGWVVASVQGLHRFYTRTDDIVASWMTRQDRELAMADNIAYVDRVIAEIRKEHAISSVVNIGFSQGAAMAFRAAVWGAAPCRGVIALGGDIPPELKHEAQWPVERALIGRGTEDPWYTHEKLQADVAFLRSIGVGVQTTVFPGGHEWTDEFRQSAAAFLESVLTRSRT